MGRERAYRRQQSRKVLVAVIDGNADHRAQVAEALASHYRVAEYTHGTEAVDTLANAPPPRLLVVDEEAPAAFRLLQELRTDKRFSGIPIIYTSRHALSSELHRDGIHAVLEKPFRRSVLLSTISQLVNKSVEGSWQTLPDLPRCALQRTVAVFNGISELIEQNRPLEYDILADACRPLVEAVASDQYRAILGHVRDHDNYSYVHSLRVATLLSLFGYTIGLRGNDLLQLGCGGLVHDIGKMFVPTDVLNKPGTLTPQEWTVMQGHVRSSIRYLRESRLPRGVLGIAALHHEKVNGKGYPFGLKGGELNELARMATIVDVFSALTDRRAYREPMAPLDALSVMTGPMAEELDQGLLSLFQNMLLEAAGV